MDSKTVAVEPEALLSPEDPPAFHVTNPGGTAPGLIVCDHASNKVPARLNGLGLTEDCLNFHIAYDIGAAGVAEKLAKELDMPAIFSGFSRLVIDINRPTDDFTSIREISDGHVVPGNCGLSGVDHQQRCDELFVPYHDGVNSLVSEKKQRAAALGLEAPVVLSVHSCTDQMRGVKRPWHIGVLYNRDERLAQATIDVLRAQNPDLTIGDNKPYSGLDAYGFTIERHALPEGIPNVLFEIRQDLIGDADGQAAYAAILGRALKVVLENESQFTLHRAGSR